MKANHVWNHWKTTKSRPKPSQIYVEKINIMEGTILPYETFMDDAYLSTFSLWGTGGHSDTYGSLCKPARLRVCV